MIMSKSLSVTAFMMEDYVVEHSPEVFPVSSEWVFFVLFYVATFGFLDFLNRGGFWVVVVKRREEPRFDGEVEGLHFGGVE